MTRWKMPVGLPPLLMALVCASCQERTTPAAPPASGQGERERPVGLKLDDHTPNLLLTWVDEHGDFHVVQKTAEVPEGSRKQVRVVITTDQPGTKDSVYVADLSVRGADGTYRVTSMPRAKWDEIGAQRRKTRMEALAPSAKPEAPAQPPRADDAAAAKLSAIVYGADWCKPCHAAEAYLKQRGVHVVKKDVDNSDAARAEMNEKLGRAGMGGAQIPIIDVMGQLLVGYSPTALDRAIDSAKKATL